MIEPEVSAPFPQDGATDAATDVQLSWDTYDPENGVSEYSMWFGTTQDPPGLPGRFVGEVFDPDTLVQSTTYYWSVGVWWDEGTLARGPVWSFATTGSSPVKSSTWGAIKALYKKQ
jgi:hypothetical protein